MRLQDSFDDVHPHDYAPWSIFGFLNNG
jgi:hypothetical protein